MWKHLRENYHNGTEKIRWFATLLSERVNVEIAVFKLLYSADRLNKKREELLKTIGMRFLELRGHSGAEIVRDGAINNVLSEIESIDKEIDELKKKASEISSVAD